MDILSPAGQQSVAQEQRAIKIWSHANPEWQYVETPKNRPAVLDAVLVKNNVVRAVVETKCRVMTYEQFAEYNHRLILTFDKMLKIKSVAEMLCIPFIVFLYLVPDDLLLWKSIWSPETDWNTNITFARTKTKTTINGGTIYRQNAFIDLREASMKRGTDGPE